MKRQTKAGVPIVPADTNEFATKDYCSYVHTGFYEGNVEFATAEFADGRCNYGSLDVWNLMQTHGDKIFLRYKDIYDNATSPNLSGDYTMGSSKAFADIEYYPIIPEDKDNVNTPESLIGFLTNKVSNIISSVSITNTPLVQSSIITISWYQYALNTSGTLVNTLIGTQTFDHVTSDIDIKVIGGVLIEIAADDNASSEEKTLRITSRNSKGFYGYANVIQKPAALFQFNGTSTDDLITKLNYTFNPVRGFRIKGSITYNTRPLNTRADAVYLYDSYSNYKQALEIVIVNANNSNKTLQVGVRNESDTMVWVKAPAGSVQYGTTYDTDIIYDNKTKVLKVKMGDIINETITDISLINAAFNTVCLTGDPQAVNGSCDCKFDNLTIYN